VTSSNFQKFLSATGKTGNDEINENVLSQLQEQPSGAGAYRTAHLFAL
jgi:hypothetical protein